MCIRDSGRTSATRILEQAGVDPNTRVRDLTSEDVKKLSLIHISYETGTH